MNVEKVVPPIDLQTIINAIPGNYLILLPDAPTFTITGATDSFLQATYKTREQLLGKPLFEAFTDDTTNENATGVTNLRASLNYVIEHRETHHIADQRYDIVNPHTGAFEYKVWAVSNRPVFNADGSIQYIIHTTEDVTEKVKLREENILGKNKLAESENRFRLMVEQAPVPILLSRGEDVVIESLNAPMLKAMNKTSFDEVLGKKMLQALPELENQPVLQIVKGVQKTGVPFRGNEVPTYVLVDGKEKQLYFNYSYTPLLEGGEVTGVLHVALDVTEQVLARQKIEDVVAQRTEQLAAANESLQQSNTELQRSNQNLEEFAHAASHDLKEPIRKITFFTHQLKEQLNTYLGEAEIRSFNRVENATERMRNLIDDLLLYSHVSQRPHETESIDLNRKVQNVLEDLELEVTEKKATINVGKLPVVKGYRRQLQQLFQNLISNALKYSKAGVPPIIDVAAEKVTEHGKLFHLVAVKDNGIGFEQEYAGKIFQMFTRLHGKAEYSGTGVGLSIVKKVVENHNGHLKVESKPGEGSTFSVLLPVE